MFKVIRIENKNIPMKSDGGTLRLYRHFFKKDMISDFTRLEEESKNGNYDMEVFENIAWVLAKRANNNIPEINDWLGKFDKPMSLPEKFEEIMDLIIDSTGTTIKPKDSKKKDKQVKK